MIHKISIHACEVAMKKDTVIRGRPCYVYRGRDYLCIPDGCIIRKVVYNAEDNTSTVYCGKPPVKIEVLSVIIMIVCILLNRLYFHEVNFSFKYNSIVNYYNGYLYLNLLNEEVSSNEVDVVLTDSNSDVILSVTLQPGESLIRIPLDSVQPTYHMSITYNTWFKELEDCVTVTVIMRDS